jgi:hypothetical protein
MIVHLYGPLPETAAEASFLTIFTGELGPPGQSEMRELDFRVMEGTIEFRQGTASGDIIVGISREGFNLRGSNATFTCDFATNSCG